jgi:hypothetical protein
MTITLYILALHYLLIPVAAYRHGFYYSVTMYTATSAGVGYHSGITPVTLDLTAATGLFAVELYYTDRKVTALLLNLVLAVAWWLVHVTPISSNKKKQKNKWSSVWHAAHFLKALVLVLM